MSYKGPRLLWCSSNTPGKLLLGSFAFIVLSTWNAYVIFCLLLQIHIPLLHTVLCPRRLTKITSRIPSPLSSGWAWSRGCPSRGEAEWGLHIFTQACSGKDHSELAVSLNWRSWLSQNRPLCDFLPSGATVTLPPLLPAGLGAVRAQMPHVPSLTLMVSQYLHFIHSPL